MIESRKFVAAAILTGLALIMAGLLLTPSRGGAHAAVAPNSIAAERIGAAFAALPSATPSPALVAAAKQAGKGDLQVRANCAAATWPNVDAACLTTADGRPAPHVRTVTIGYEAAPATTVLVRLPTTEIAQR